MAAPSVFETEGKKARCSAAIAALLLAGILAVPYVKAELLTAWHGEEFAQEYKQCGMIDQIEYFKITSYNDEDACVFYVTGAHSSGVRMNFSGGAGNWKLSDWSAVWSDSGSADGFCWPYYR